MIYISIAHEKFFWMDAICIVSADLKLLALPSFTRNGQLPSLCPKALRLNPPCLDP